MYAYIYGEYEKDDIVKHSVQNAPVELKKIWCELYDMMN